MYVKENTQHCHLAPVDIILLKLCSISSSHTNQSPHLNGKLLQIRAFMIWFHQIFLSLFFFPCCWHLGFIGKLRGIYDYTQLWYCFLMVRFQSQVKLIVPNFREQKVHCDHEPRVVWVFVRLLLQRRLPAGLSG